MKNKTLKSKPTVRHFVDALQFNSEDKTAVSVRDGVMEYVGAELGIEPADKIFTVYRSPATISNAANRMQDLVVTDDHVDDADNIDPNLLVGSVIDSSMIDSIEEGTGSQLAVKNKIKIEKLGFLDTLKNGKRQLSLGYEAEIVPHNVYDFEQKNIMPNHLAIVQDARGGSVCSFLDKNGVITMKRNLRKAKKATFKDADQPSLQEIISTVEEFKNSVRTASMDSVLKVMPMMQAVIEASKKSDVNEDTTEVMQDDEDQVDAKSDDNETDVAPAANVVDPDDDDDSLVDLQDEDDDDKDDGSFLEKERSIGRDEGRDEGKDDRKSEGAFDFDKGKEAEKKKLNDSRAFKDAMKVAISNHTAVLEKAMKFLDASYSFKDKSTASVMRECLKTQYGSQRFNDRELSTAFKMLRPAGTNLRNFGDSDGANTIMNLQNKEL